MKTVLTIAGSDSIGGAGIQADLKTMCAHKVYGMTVIAALTAQNTMGVQGIHTPPPEFVTAQIDSVFTDIFPDAVKIGMLANAGIIQAVADGLAKHHARNIVLDPVMISTSNHRLLEESAEKVLIKVLLPLADVITPNLPEAAALAGSPKITTREQMQEAARRISSLTKAAILVKGGHLADCADDLLFAGGEQHWFSTPHIDTDNTHGTGCTLSSAIASNLALGHPLVEAVRLSKDYITGALRNDPHLGHGNGPLNHLYAL
ncbi:MAG: bifunctional hydroxymethylpyrimidine kinase/phosphomethylpyrimidine kinase [Victivallales bacterium]|nr:bifunctional hydroxymethylpyrimidine kinase/phosphomethylpyrimidine kinase [Victivallales bacterium]